MQKFLPLYVITDFRSDYHSAKYLNSEIYTTLLSNSIQKFLPLCVITKLKSVYHYAKSLNSEVFTTLRSN